MSESPANGISPGPASTTPNGTTNQIRRRKPQANLFMAKKGAQRAGSRQGTPSASVNPTKPAAAATTVPSSKSSVPLKKPDPDDDPSTYVEHRLVATKKDIIEGFRFHAMRLLSRQTANPFDPKQFERPLRLHRRYVRDKKLQLQPEAPESTLDDKEREKEEIRKAELQAIKEANQAQIAPTQKTAPGSAKKKNVAKAKAEDVYYSNTPEEDKRRRLRYDEARPWHLEDFDGNNTWVGSYEEPLTETYAMFVIEEAGFRMVPIEKWYKFAPTGRFEPKDYDFVERWMNKKTHGAAALIQRRQEAEEIRLRKMQERKDRERQVGPRQVKDEDELFRLDNDDTENLDFKEEEDFQDDDEGELLGFGDHVEESKEQIKKEMLGANIFKDLKEEKDWDAEEAKAKADRHKRRREEKKLRKALMKREKKFEYETDRSDTDGPIESSSSESEDDTDAEKEKDNGELTLDDPESKDFAPGKIQNGDSSTKTGTSSVASNTPGGRAEKRGGVAPGNISTRGIQSTASSSSLKRPGSPNLSDVSGSESSRKRMKASKVTGDGSNGARPSSPTSARIRNAGSGSDTEMSGTELSVTGGARKKRRPQPGHQNGLPPSGTATPSASGARSPLNRPSTPLGGSRASSPGAAGPGAAGASLPSVEEIKAAIPPAGIKITALIQMFKARLPGGPNANRQFIAMVKAVGQASPVEKGLIIPKE